VTTRETLKAAARELYEASQSPNPLYTEKMQALAAALRLLATRFDEEEAVAERRMHMPAAMDGMILLNDAAELVAAAISRLDAPLVADTPKETDPA
jgi:hypothetical protein